MSCMLYRLVFHSHGNHTDCLRAARVVERTGVQIPPAPSPQPTKAANNIRLVAFFFLKSTVYSRQYPLQYLDRGISHMQ